jgi:hypothetical protein
METIRSILREHGAAATKEFLDQAIKAELTLLENRLVELRQYLGVSTPVAAVVPASTSESPVPLQQEESPSPVDKPKRVKPQPNSNRKHPIARAKAKSAIPPPPSVETTPTPETSQTDGKPARGVLKAEQRRKEATKRKELETQGINPTSLLTKENLASWLSAGKTYSQIAREEVGLREEDVSAAAKKHGLSSQRRQPTGKEQVIVTKEPATASEPDA